MNQTITSREELLLAKIAGHDVDIKTMTPGVASNLSEQFMLEIADRLDNMGGGQLQALLEVVPETEVPLPHVPEDFKAWIVDITEEQKNAVIAADQLYFNSSAYPLTKFEDEAPVWAYNIVIEDDAPALIEDDKPGHYVTVGEGDSDGFVLMLLSTEDFTGETVKILTDSQSGGGSNEFLVTADLVIGGGGQPGLDNLSATIEEIGAAVEAGKFVRMHARTQSDVDWMSFDGYLGLYFDDGPFAVFTAGALSGETPTIVYAIISEEAPVVQFVEIGSTPSDYPIPAYTTDDIGKVLGVVSDGSGGATIGWVTKS